MRQYAGRLRGNIVVLADDHSEHLSQWRRRSDISYAARTGDLQAVQRLLVAGAAVDRQYEYGQTVLMWAAHSGQLEIVRLLLDAGAAVDLGNNRGSTALMWAARGGHIPVVECLLTAGAAVDHQNNGGETALMWAVREGHQDTVRYIEEFQRQRGVGRRTKAACRR